MSIGFVLDEKMSICHNYCAIIKHFYERGIMAVTPEIRIANRNTIYMHLYNNRQSSKPGLSHELSLSLPTVAVNLNDLLEDGLIRIGGVFESNGGRKPKVYQCIPDARVAIGVETFLDHIYLCLLNLYGETLSERFLREPYKNAPTYYEKIGHIIKDFAEESGYEQDRILGVGIATQGVVSPDHTCVVYGRILGNEGLTVDAFSQYFSYPCILLHDSEAAAFAESFYKRFSRDACYILLNHNLGSGLIMNQTVYGGNHSRGQLLEHMRLVPGGRKCYCGKMGCAECYCSAGSLEENSGLPLDVFFEKLREGDSVLATLWEDYLSSLSHLLYNTLMTIDVDVVLGGLVSLYMKQEDLETLWNKVNNLSDFAITERSVSLHNGGRHISARGAALYYIRQFLADFYPR